MSFSPTLEEVLKARRMASLLSDAQLIHEWPQPTECLEQAKRLVRSAMYEHALGRCSTKELRQVYTLLDFAIEKYQSRSHDLCDALSVR